MHPESAKVENKEDGKRLFAGVAKVGEQKKKSK